jgi:DNA-binding NarL/FixJ family response regulator
MRVLIIAENRVAAEAIRRALRYSPHFDVVGFIHGRAPCGALASDRGAELLLIGELPAELRRQRVAEGRRALPRAKIVVLANTTDQDELADLVTAGIDAAISANAGAPAIGVLIRAIAAGHVFQPVVPGARAASDAGPRPDGLTNRQLQILRLVASGLPNGQIADRLGVTQQTVKFHLSNIYRTLGLSNRSASAHYAHSRALLGAEPAADHHSLAA